MVVDCLVIGGGVIGLTTAWRLAQRGLRVRVCDQSHPGREASWAGAGILPPGCPGGPTDPVVRLTGWTNRLWPLQSSELLDSTGIDNEYHRCGGLELAVGTRSELMQEQLRWAAIGARTEWLEPDEVRHLEPDTAGREPAFFLPDLCQVRNPRHLQALLRACQLAGVEITPECPVTAWKTDQGQITTAVTPEGNIAAGQYLVTAGAWSSTLLMQAGVSLEIIPVRGQIVLIAPREVTFTRAIERGKRYLVPRRDGRILIGSTEELVGFEKGNTPAGIHDLIEFAATISPRIASATIETQWSGLRPCADRGRPFIGRVPGLSNLLVASGHFRAGLHLSPATAQILVDLVCGRSIHGDWHAFGL